jgi:hypothetical protein
MTNIQVSTKRMFSYLGVAALIVWSYGLVNTVAFIEQLGIPRTGYYSLYVGFALQLVLTFAQHVVWTKQKDKRITIIGITVLLIDVFTNFAGINVLIQNLNQTESYKQLSLPNEPSGYIIFALSFMIAMMVALLPEVLVSGQE